MSALLQQISSQTGGRSRKLDMGSAKAAAQHVNGAAVQGLLEQVKAELDLCKEFEVAYAKRLNLEQSLGARGGTTVGSVKQPHHASPSHPNHASATVTQASAKRVEESALQQNKRRPAQKIPTIAATSNLLRGTAARKKYSQAILAESKRTAGLINGNPTRSSRRPAKHPGSLKSVEAGTVHQPPHTFTKRGSQKGVGVRYAGQPNSEPCQDQCSGDVTLYLSTSGLRTRSPSNVPEPSSHPWRMQNEDMPSHVDKNLSTVRAEHMDFSVPHADLMRALYKIDA